MSDAAPAVVPVESIAQSILNLRGQTVILDSDLARLYGVSTKQLNQAVKRNQARFPVGFMLQLTQEEKTEVVTKCDHLQKLKFSRTLPYAFSEHGAVMAATILNTPRAVEVSVYVVRAFLRLRHVLAAHEELAEIVAELVGRVDGHDQQIGMLIDAIGQLLAPPESPQKRIGFRPDEATLKKQMEAFEALKGAADWEGDLREMRKDR